jgi:hypothetical protein
MCLVCVIMFLFPGSSISAFSSFGSGNPISPTNSTATTTIFPSSVNYASDRVLVVPTSNYPTVQSAINAARSGDTVIVRPGTYTEQLFINKSIALIGYGEESTSINPPNKLVADALGAYWGVHISNSATVFISGFSFSNLRAIPLAICTTNNAPFCAEIGVDGHARLTLVSSVIHYSFFTNGLWVGFSFSSARAVVSAVDFEIPQSASKNATYYGIYVSGGSSLQLSYSKIVARQTFGGDTDDIFLDSGSTAQIFHSTLMGAAAVYVNPQATADISFNRIITSGLSAFTGAIAGATFAAITIGYGSNVRISYNRIVGEPNVFYGILAYASSSVSDPTVALISHNTLSNFLCKDSVGRPEGFCGPDELKFQNQFIGIYVIPEDFACGCGPYPQTTPNKISITQNFIFHSDVGISLQAVENCCVVSQNVIFMSTDFGVQADEGNYTFSNNIIVGAKYGINVVGGFFSLIGLPSSSATVVSVDNIIRGASKGQSYILAVPPYTARVVYKSSG